MLRIFFILIFLSTSAWSHPVIYKDGWALSSSNMPSYAENYVMYSFSSKAATGIGQWRFSNGEENTEFAMAKINYLAWRHNGEDSQANVYLHGGAGLVDHEFEPKDTREAYLAGIDLDWETRKLFTSFKHYQFISPGLTDIPMTQARVGFSPRLSDFKDLQTWFMLQGMYTPDVDRSVMITPLVRFFYHNVLWEMGASTRGDWLLNLMVHY